MTKEIDWSDHGYFRQEAEEWLSAAKGKPLSIDTETNGEDIRDGRGYATTISAAFKFGDRYFSHCFPFRLPGEGNYDKDVLERLKEVIQSAPSIVFHNAKFDLVSLKTLGIDYFGKRWFCTMVMAHLVDENRPRSKSLNDVSRHYLGEQFHKADDELFKAAVTIYGWGGMPVHLMREYSTVDAELPLRLAPVIMKKMKEEGLEEYWQFKRKLIEVVIQMESLGVRVDTEFCKKKIAKAEEEMEKAKNTLGFNIGSTKELGEYILDELLLPVVKTTPKGQPSFDKYAMEQYEKMLNELGLKDADHVLSFRGWRHAKSLYFEPYLEKLSPDGRLRPNYMHHRDESEGGTVSGRLSCNNPNLQQIPKESTKPWNGDVKSAFIPDEGYELFSIDFSQIELRLTAALSNEEVLLEVFEEGRDIFTEMSESLEMSRDDTKTFVYSTQYGGGVNRIKTVFNISESRARQIRQNYFDTYPNIKRLSDRARFLAESKGVVPIWSGRKRHFAKPREESHKGLNSIIQGGAADIVERAMIKVYDNVVVPSNGDVRMLLQIHDELWFEIKEGMSDHYLPIIEKNMVDVEPYFGVKFAVESEPVGGGR